MPNNRDDIARKAEQWAKDRLRKSGEPLSQNFIDKVGLAFRRLVGVAFAIPTAKPAKTTGVEITVPLDDK